MSTGQQRNTIRPVIDEHTIRRINFGDENAFATLYDAYWAWLCANAATFIRNAEAAKDIVNDIFIKVWKSRRNLRSPIHPYLVASLRNSCLNYLRNHRNDAVSQEELSLLESDILRTESHTPLSYTEAAEVSEKVRKVADDLPDKCRMVFHLYFFNGMDPKAIAEELGIAPSTVRVQLKIALDRIRAALGMK